MTSSNATFVRKWIGLLAGAAVPVVVIAAVGFQLSPFIFMVGLPIAWLVASVLMAPVLFYWEARGRLTRSKAIALGALAAPAPLWVLQSDTIIKSLTGRRTGSGLITSGPNNVVDELLTGEGWLNMVAFPSLALAALGSLGAIVGWWIAFGQLGRQDPPTSE